MIQSQTVQRQMPAAGDRVGRVCGPCDFPRDNQGTVLVVTADQWYSNIALILWDDGKTGTSIGAYQTVGIGVYLLKRGEVVQ